MQCEKVQGQSIDGKSVEDDIKYLASFFENLIENAENIVNGMKNSHQLEGKRIVIIND